MDNCDYIQNLKDELLEQFKEKINIKALVEVVGKQLNDIKQFYDDLNHKTNIFDAVGKQLDGIGDIAVLSRIEAGQMVGKENTTINLDDETYRKYLIYKVLKNTCNCTYYDTMKAINMFWNGPPLKYSESFDEPATIIFDFDVEKDIADMATAIPYVKAGGVGLHLNMHKTDEVTAYVGFAYKRTVKATYECAAPVLNIYKTVEVTAYVGFAYKRTVKSIYKCEAPVLE